MFRLNTEIDVTTEQINEPYIKMGLRNDNGPYASLYVPVLLDTASVITDNQRFSVARNNSHKIILRTAALEAIYDFFGVFIYKNPTLRL